MHYRGWLICALVAASGTIGVAKAQDAGKSVIASTNAPAAVGPYSQAIKVGKTIYLSGQIAIDPKTKQMMADASIEDQTKRVLENLKAVLVADGMTLDNIVSTTVFVKDLNDFGKVNEAYASFFYERAPGPCDG